MNSYAHAEERPPTQPLRSTAQISVLAFAFASVCLLGSMAAVDSPHHDLILHYSGNVRILFGALLFDALVLWAAVFAVLMATRRMERVHKAVETGLVCAIPWIVVKQGADSLGLMLPHAWSLALFVACATTWVLLVLAWRSTAYERVWGALHVMVLVCGAVGALMLVEAAWFGVQARGLNEQTGEMRHDAMRPGVPKRNRVIWVLMDELGYAPLFGERLPGLALPAFDALKREATVFSNVVPAGRYTAVVMPELLTGRAADEVRGDSHGRLTMLDEGKAWPFDEQDTVFADADQMGYSSAVVGWYMPYCRMLPTVLSSCLWSGDRRALWLEDRPTMASSLWYPLAEVAAGIPQFLYPSRVPALSDREVFEGHVTAYKRLYAAADEMLRDSQTTFLLLHMPLPHPEGIWNRKTREFAVEHSAYVDNLALADEYLAHVRAVLEAAGEWDDATVIVMGDHGWRVGLIWRKTRSWSAEDEAASQGGKTDLRPAVIVKLPGQSVGAEIPESFRALRTRALLDALLAGTVRDAAQLRAWVAAGDGRAIRTPEKISAAEPSVAGMGG